MSGPLRAQSLPFPILLFLSTDTRNGHTRFLSPRMRCPCSGGFRSLAWHATETVGYNNDIDGKHCYRVAQQGLLVHNMSAGVPPYEEFNGRHDPDRERKNTCNVATYFRLHSYRVLHIGAGDNPFPNSLPEDIDQYAKKEYPYLLAIPGDPISQYLPPGELFDKVVLINIRLPGRNPDYGPFFKLAATVMKFGAVIVWAALDGNHTSIDWAIKHEKEIAGFGFTKVSPTTTGQFEDAPPEIRNLPGSAYKPGVGMVAYSNLNAVQVVWKKN